MTSVVFLRAVNVGGRVLKMHQLADSLAPLEVRSVGAAGTLIVGGRAPGPEIRRAVLRALPFSTAVMVIPAEKVLGLLDSMPFGPKHSPGGTKRYVSILESQPRRLPSLPLRRPDSDHWEVSVTQLLGDFVLSLRRRMSERRVLYSNEVVEKEFQCIATTRGWETIERVGSLLRGDKSSTGSDGSGRAKPRAALATRGRNGPSGRPVGKRANNRPTARGTRRSLGSRTESP